MIEAEISHGGFALLLPCIPSSMETKEKRAIRLQEVNKPTKSWSARDE